MELLLFVWFSCNRLKIISSNQKHRKLNTGLRIRFELKCKQIQVFPMNRHTISIKQHGNTCKRTHAHTLNIWLMNRDVLKLLSLKTSRLALLENAFTKRTYGQVIIMCSVIITFFLFFYFNFSDLICDPVRTTLEI